MIPMKNFRMHFEKNASTHGKAFKAGFNFVRHHPWITLGTVGAAAGVAGAASLIHDTSVAVLPTYHILNEQRKRGVMDNQTSILKKISDSIQEKKTSQDNKYAIPYTEPLA